LTLGSTLDSLRYNISFFAANFDYCCVSAGGLALNLKRDSSGQNKIQWCKIPA
jgi:hypothetical protein